MDNYQAYESHDHSEESYIPSGGREVPHTCCDHPKGHRKESSDGGNPDYRVEN